LAEHVFIGLGSNIGCHYVNCTRAIREVLSDERSTLRALSSLYYTSPVSAIPQPDILNGAFTIEWRDSAVELLSLLKQIEARMGRLEGERNGPRIIDLDILLFGHTVIRFPDLIVPHPRLHERRFALVPCLEIDPTLVHPTLEKGLDELLDSIEEEQRTSWFCSVKEEDVQPISDGPAHSAPRPDRIKVRSR
jgi:2-amino-4-hydroxy-6-hydroxymethyldihydropteridine diphosphokinase